MTTELEWRARAAMRRFADENGISLYEASQLLGASIHFVDEKCARRPEKEDARHRDEDGDENPSDAREG